MAGSRVRAAAARYPNRKELLSLDRGARPIRIVGGSNEFAVFLFPLAPQEVVHSAESFLLQEILKKLASVSAAM